MKLTAMIVIMSLLCGCAAVENDMDRVLSFRQQLLQSNECSFNAMITADYEEVIYTFQMSCTVDSSGVLTFTVTDPQTIEGITGTISDNGAALTFDEEVLAFPTLAQGQATPVSAPWIFINAIRGGYLSGCGREGDGLRISVDDSYEDNPLHLEILTDDQIHPVQSEIYWNGNRILSLDIEQFTMQ